MSAAMRHLRSTAGVTFIEVLAALGLFSVVAVGLTTSIVSDTKLGNQSRVVAAAASLAQDKTEQLRMIQPVLNAVPGDLTLGTHVDPSDPMTWLGGTQGTLTRTWTVTGVPQYLGNTVVGVRPGIVQVAVTVSWSTPMSGSITNVTFACTSPTCG
jgi:Tfp pilus assembly protein PilV